jgi:two-component system OmpR family response regulator
MFPTFNNRFGSPDFTGSTILVVDDHQDSLDFVSQVLQFCGARVLTAWSTAHARAHLRIATPQLVVCDFQMPRETGVEFMRWLRSQDDEHADIPAIAVTGYPRDFLRQRDVAFAFDAYFEKPLDIPRFLGMAEVLLLKPKRSGDLKRA